MKYGGRVVCKNTIRPHTGGTAMIRFNKREVIIPFFQVGVPEPDLAATIEVVRKAQRAQKAA